MTRKASARPVPGSSIVGGRPGKAGGVRNRQPRFARVALRGSVEGVGPGPLADAVRGDSVAFLAGPRNSLSKTDRRSGTVPRSVSVGAAPRPASPTFKS